ncbi:MAG: glycosyl hydrolase family 65 protein, partial [Termitinemataceae bacterium]
SGGETDTHEALYNQLEQGLAAYVESGYSKEFEAHRCVMEAFWQDTDVEIRGDNRALRALRFNLFHLSSCANPEDEYVSIGAKGLHGEGYKGHVFWDTETFMLPFFIFTQPSTARSLLAYRYHTLQGARQNAQHGGFQGARFPWESADTGLEVTPPWGVDYAGHRVRIWTGEQEVHISADITYAILKYLQVSGDAAFLRTQGLQILLETAQFWASYAKYNEKLDRYEIQKVIGPDEFHEHVNNNAYTNYLAAWALRKTIAIVKDLEDRSPTELEEILKIAQVTAADLERWELIANKLYIPVTKDGLIEQFEGYFSLKDIPITEWDANGMPRWPKDLDVRRLSETQLIKQPDVVMLFALLGEEFPLDQKIKNYEYYEKRTMHKSSLSPSIYAMVGLSLGKHDHAYEYFIKAAETDLVDNQGNTAHGLHAANTGGTWQSAVLGFGGLSVDKDGVLRVEPWLPPHWESLRYHVYWKGIGVTVEVGHQEIRVSSEQPIPLRAGAGEYTAGPAGVKIPLAEAGVHLSV